VTAPEGIALCGRCLRLLTPANRASGYYSICRECEQELDGWGTEVEEP